MEDIRRELRNLNIEELKQLKKAVNEMIQQKESQQFIA
jgi:HAMP domain-containing protein